MKNKDFFKRSKSEIFAELRRILDLHDYVIKIETTDRNAFVDKFFFKNHTEFSISTIAWQKKNFLNYKRYKAKIAIKNEEIFKYTKKELKIILLSDIYKQIIKNNIMMI